MNYIYTLSDPVTNQVRYIGKTNHLGKRLWSHLHSKDRSHKTSWIKSLKGLDPVMEILEEYIDEKESYSAEMYWIGQFKVWGFNLVNLTSGGEGASSKDVLNFRNSNASISNSEALEIGLLLRGGILSITEIARTRRNSAMLRAVSLKESGLYTRQSKKVKITTPLEEVLIFENVGKAADYLTVSRSTIIKYCCVDKKFRNFKIEYYENSSSC